MRTKEIAPVDWARSMSNLANAYQQRIRGDRANNLEKAIHTVRQSLEILTKVSRPMDWAQSTNNLANAYLERIHGDKAENIELAIRAHKRSIEIRTRDAMPVRWANSMSNLGGAYQKRIYGDKAENIEAAIDAYKQSIEVRTRQTMPFEWAKSMNSLAVAYSNRICGDKEKNIEAAIDAYKQSMEVRTRQTMPVQWANSMSNLAYSYLERVRGDRTQNIKAAINICSQSLEILTPEEHPNDCRRAARILASLYAGTNQWSKAQATCEKALTASEILYQAAFSKGSQESEIFETYDFYRRAAYANAKVGDLKTAIATLEQGRARGLSETLQRDRANLETIRKTNPDLVDRYQTAANAINQLESTERRLTTNNQLPQYSQEDFRQQATQARQSLKDCITEIRQIPGYENFLSLPTFEDVAVTVQLDHPLIYLVSTPNGSLALTLTTESISEIWLNDLTEPQLVDILYDNWFKAYRERQTNHQDWRKAVDNVTYQLWDRLMAPLVGHLQQNNLSQAILIPTGYLSYLPLHAAWTPDTTKPTGRRYACDDIQFTYAPNALSLNATRTAAEKTTDDTLLAISEPYSETASGLPNASAEIVNAITTFKKENRNILQAEDATRTAVLEQLPHKNIAHFACHGFADLATPLNSGLLMANDEKLSLRDLLDLKLQNLRLAILSACETGIPGTKLPDEVISLPTGLLQAGAAGVVSSLWSVADLSTMLLISRFYDLWRTEKLAPSVALHQAQKWLRDSDRSALSIYLKDTQTLKQLPEQRPFAHPFYWAAFTYTGI